MVRTLLLLVGLFVGSTIYSSAQTFTATIDSSDAYVQLRWNLPAGCFNAGGGRTHRDGVFLKLEGDGKVVYSEVIIKDRVEQDTGSFRHFIGPNLSVNYRLTLLVRGPGTVITACSNFTATGRTTPYRPPTLMAATDSIFPDRVELSWKNNSHLSSSFLIIRKEGVQETLVATVNGTTDTTRTLSFIDAFNPVSASSLVNGREYTYCVRTFSQLTRTIYGENVYPSICDLGSTRRINFSATDNQFPNQVQMQWNDMSAFADQLQITRNGEVIALLENPAQTDFVDLQPIYGFPSIYAVGLIKEDRLTVAASDTGSVAPIGKISGFIRTPEGYGIGGVSVERRALIFDSLFVGTTVTDYRGYYEFDDLFFGVQSFIVLKASKTGVQISPDSLRISLSVPAPKVEQANFIANLNLQPNTDSLAILGFRSATEPDQLTFDWDFFSEADTTYFQLYREGRLIGIWDKPGSDTTGMSVLLRDRTGEPGFFYRYRLRAYILSGDSIREAVLLDTFQFPAITVPTNPAVTANFDSNSMGVLTLSWQHNSNNFGGFRIYRNDTLIATIDSLPRAYTDYFGEPGRSYIYSVAAYRIANGKLYESQRVSAPAQLYPVLFDPIAVSATPLPTQNAVQVDWQIPPAQTNDDNFTGFKVFRNGVEIGETLKGSPLTFVDRLGEPGISYNYAVLTFVEHPDTLYLSDPGLAPAVSYPNIPTPPAITTATGIGKISVSWPDSYNTGNDNFDGFILSAVGVRSDTLKRGAVSHDLYLETEANQNITLQAFRRLAGQIFVSASSASTGNATIQPQVLEAPSQFKASTEYPMHVALTWTYPVYKLSRFIIIRDGVAIDTMPTEARAYYDYGVEPGVAHEYSIRAIFEGSVSHRLTARGIRKNRGAITGQVRSTQNGRNVDSLLVRLLNGPVVLDQTFTDDGGLFSFEDLPLSAEQGALSVQVETAGRNVVINSATAAIQSLPFVNRDTTISFNESFTPDIYPPDPLRDSIVTLAGVEVKKYRNKFGLRLGWALKKGKFDGFEVYRSATKKKIIEDEEEELLEDDDEGSAGIDYAYFVRAFVDRLEGRQYGVAVQVETSFPMLEPVENLSAIPAYNGNSNSVILNWSHRTDDVSFYQIERNDQVLTLIPRGSALSYEDKTGKPNQQYTYTVRPLRQKGQVLNSGDPVTVTTTFPVVANPDIVLAVPVQDSNAVHLKWAYQGPYVDGFRLLRDGFLINTFGKNQFEFFDKTGLPDTTHQYALVAVLNRDGMSYQSRGADTLVTFPELDPVDNLSTTANLQNGLTDIFWMYKAGQIDSFVVDYMVTAPISITRRFIIPFEELENGEFKTEDRLAVPGANIMYMVTAVSNRLNLKTQLFEEFRSVPVSSSRVYPNPPTPTNVLASQGTFDNRVELSWETSFGANIDGFLITRRDQACPGCVPDTIAQVGEGIRTYVDIFSNIGNNTSLTYVYQVISFNDVSNSFINRRFRSSPAAATGWAGINRALVNGINRNGNFSNSQYGFSLALEDDYMAVGAPNSEGGNGRVSFLRYNQNQNTWNEYSSYSPGAGFMEAGYSIDFAEEEVIFGAPGSGATSDFGSIFLFQNVKSAPSLAVPILVETIANARLGQDVALARSSSDIFFALGISNDPPTDVPSFYYAQRAANNWSSFFKTLLPEGQPYVSVAAAGVTAAGGTGRKVDIWKETSGFFNIVQTLPANQPSDGFGQAVAMEGEMLIVGAPNRGPGTVYFYRQGGDGNYILEQIIDRPPAPSNTTDDRFGSSLAVFGNYLLVGSSNHIFPPSGQREGAVFVFERRNGRFVFVDIIFRPENSICGGGQFGRGMDVNANHLIIGDPAVNCAGKIYHYRISLVELWYERLSNVQASDGAFRNQTRISWAFTGDRNYISGFNIYRDDELIGEADPNASFFFDPDGTPGKVYTYKVTVTAKGDESRGRSDTGFRQGNGVLEGDVLSVVGGSPVPGTIITASAVVRGQKYIYRDTTDQNGHFYIGDAYYADTVATYSLMASFEDHVYVTNPISATLSPETNTKSNLIFFDRSAFVLTGTVVYDKAKCPIDSVAIRLTSIFDNGQRLSETAFTDDNGFYSLVVRPTETGLVEILLEIDSLRTIAGQDNSVAQATGMGTDTILHHFRPRLDGAAVAAGASVQGTSISFTNFIAFPRKINIDFADTLTYQAEFFVTTVCGTPAGQPNSRFVIEVSTFDGCYQERITTGTNAKALVNLPPLDGLIITVQESNPLTVANILVVDYLRYRPNMLDLRQIHIDNWSENYSAPELKALVDQRLVYHKPPTIDLLNEFPQYVCDDPENPGLIQQGSLTTLTFSVTEEHNGIDCRVNEGYLVVNNAAAAGNNTDTLFYLPERGRFEPHVFIAGEPNLVPPFRRGINIKYYSAIGDLLGEIILPVVITGSTQLPGSDILVDPKDDEGQLKFPIYILRDPPGDNSFSSIEEGTTFTRSLTRTDELKSGVGFKTDLTGIIAKVGLFLETEFKGGGAVNKEESLEITTTTTQTISTSSSADFVGVNSDVLVGVGVATRYGISELLTYDAADCPTMPLTKIRSFGISADSIRTNWFYTVGQIKQLIAEKQAQKVQIQQGTFTLTKNNVPLSKAEAIARLDVEIFNWEETLKYHSTTSLPHVMFCAETYSADDISDILLSSLANQRTPIALSFSPETLSSVFDANQGSSVSNLVKNQFSLNTRVTKAQEIQRGFCNEVGTYSATNNFTLKNNILWTNNLARKYEQATAGVAYYLDSLTLSLSQISDRIANFRPGTRGFFPEIENTTFSGGVDVVKSTQVSRTTKSNFTSKSYIDFQLAGGFAAESISIAGFGFSTSVEDNSQKIGGVFELNWENGQSSEVSSQTAVTSSYTLSDDEPGDQFSVTAIRGRDPGHSPYFQTLGGRSSCPPEAGTIHRDQYDLSLYDPTTQSTFDFLQLDNLPADENATFYLQVTNNSPFGELRDVFIYYDATTNTEGAVLTLEGQYMGGGNQDGQTLAFLPPGRPYIIPMFLLPVPGKYQYENIKIVMRQSCTDGNLFLYESFGDGFKRDTVTVSAFYDSPCSDISIASPGDDWRIRRRNPFDPSDREKLLIELRDYDPFNDKLEDVVLEYRRIGSFDNFSGGWKRIPPPQLEPSYRLSRDSLEAYNARNFGPGQIPKLFVIWDITELYDEYPDGEYEIRAVARCGASGVVNSNSVYGVINRSSIGVYAITQPADGIWQRGDEISILVNRQFNCARVNDMKFQVFDLSNNRAQIPGRVACFGDKLIFFPDNPMLNYDDHILEARATNLFDQDNNLFPIIIDNQGNAQLDTFVWSFRVIARDIYVADPVLSTTMYQGAKTTLSTQLFSNTGANLNFQLVPQGAYPWLTITPTAGIVPGAAGRQINFAIDAKNLPIGDTTAVIVALPNPGMGADTIRIRVKVLATPPFWVVDPSLYSSSMTVNANYQYLGENTVSQDSMDLISVWIDEEIRGVGRISTPDGIRYSANLLVYGNPADQGKTLEFRVWDASVGIEYNASPQNNQVFTFTSNGSIGTFINPEILLVNRARDRARYIPLNGGGRWTWFSVNSQESNMNVNRVLRSLKSAASGDIIKTASTSASFLPNSGWISTNGLSSVRPEDGYQIFLNGPADTIRITGANATFKPIALANGFNFIGYPLQDSIAINTALNIIGVSNGDNIRTVAQNPLKFSPNMFAQYLNGTWFTSGPAMDKMRPNFAYLIQVNGDKVLLYPGATPLQGETASFQGSPRSATVADPNLPETWTVNPADFAQNMVMTAVLEINGQLSVDSLDLVGAFVNGECRGVSRPRFIPQLGKYIVTLFVYSNKSGEEVEIRFLDADSKRLHFNENYFSFRSNELVGSFAQPQVLRNKQFRAEYALENAWCADDRQASVKVEKVAGLTPPLSYSWNNGGESETLGGLSAGRYWVTITGSKGQWFVDTVEIRNVGRSLPLPEVTGAEEAVCPGSELTLKAGTSLEGATFRWYDESGRLLRESAELLVPGLMENTTLQVATVYRGCQSELSPVKLELRIPEAAFEVQPATMIQLGDSLQFRSLAAAPGYRYHWDFGDGQTSEQAQPVHRYTKPGWFSVELTLEDEAGCRNQLRKEGLIQVEMLSDIWNPQGADFRLSASPNPFVNRLDVAMGVPKADLYQLTLLDIQGRPLWNQEQDLVQGEHRMSLNFSDLRLPDGVYFLRLGNTEDKAIFVKIIRARP